MTGRILVAGVGNVFLGDDAFGVEVARLLAERPQPPGVQVRDYGIRGVHLVYELLDGYDLFVLVDAAPRGEAPGTVSVLEVDLPGPQAQPVIDAHSLTPDAIFGLLSSLGGRPGRSLVVACEPAEVDPGMACPVRSGRPCRTRCAPWRRSWPRRCAPAGRKKARMKARKKAERQGKQRASGSTWRT